MGLSALSLRFMAADRTAAAAAAAAAVYFLTADRGMTLPKTMFKINIS